MKIETFKEILERNDIDFIETYSNGEDGLWGFDKKRTFEIIIKVNDMPDEEIVEDFEEQIKDMEENLIKNVG